MMRKHHILKNICGYLVHAIIQSADIDGREVGNNNTHRANTKIARPKTITLLAEQIIV
jgi:hypothetical protein